MANDFIELEAPEILTYNFVNTVASNCNIIYNLLLSKGKTPDGLTPVNVSESTALLQIKTFLENLESNFDKLNDDTKVAEYKSIYYQQQKVVGDFAENKTDIQRWCDIMNDMYALLTGQYSEWKRIKCTEGGDNYPTINGNYLYCHGGG